MRFYSTVSALHCTLENPSSGSEELVEYVALCSAACQ